jgi:hypothetical protein
MRHDGLGHYLCLCTRNCRQHPIQVLPTRIRLQAKLRPQLMSQLTGWGTFPAHQDKRHLHTRRLQGGTIKTRDFARPDQGNSMQ